MFVWVISLVQKFWGLFGYAVPHRREVDAAEDRIWSRDLQKHANGELSYSAVQGREDPLAEHSQVDVSSNNTFVGVYDGHSGNEASVYLSQHLLPNILGILKDDFSEEEFVVAFDRVEREFTDYAKANVARKPFIYASGSSVLIAVVRAGKLLVCHLGDSRAVLGVITTKFGFFNTGISSEPLTNDHSVKLEDVRREMWRSHGEDAVEQDPDTNMWKIKGRVEVSRSFGDLYLKNPKFAIKDRNSNFYLDKPITRPILSSVPSVLVRDITQSDSFVVLASDGLCKYLGNDEVVKFVHANKRSGVAKKLVESAIGKAEEMRKKRLEAMGTIPQLEVGRAYDDITVVVLFFDKKGVKKSKLEEVSLTPVTPQAASIVKNTSDEGSTSDMV